LSTIELVQRQIPQRQVQQRLCLSHQTKSLPLQQVWVPHHQTEQVLVSSSQRVHLLVQGAEWSYRRDRWKVRVPESIQTNLLMEQVLV